MADTTTHHGFQKLKALLLDSEQASLSSMRGQLDALTGRLDGVADRLDTVFNRTGTDERLTSSVAEVLDRALREAEVNRHEQLSGAVAPLVVKTIKTELRNSQDEMVEALYPITGRMVKSYVASALRDLTEQINRRLEQNALMLRLKSLATGRSVADLAIADTQRLAVEEVYLIRRGVGELVARHPEASPGAAPSNSDVQFSGLMTAINDFASEAFAHDGGAIRSFRFDDFHVYLRASPLYLIAARCRGVAPPGLESILDEEFLATLSVPGFDTPDSGRLARSALPRLAGALEQRAGAAQEELSRAGIGFNPLKWLLILAGLALVAWFGWGVYADWVKQDVRRRAESALASIPGLKGYPTSLVVTEWGRTVSLSGLAPNEATRREALERLRAAVPQTAVAEQLSVLPKPSNAAEVEVARVRDQLAALEADLARTAIIRLIARADVRIGQTVAELDRLAENISDADRKTKVAALKDRLVSVAREVAGYRRAADAKDGAEDLTGLTGAFARATRNLEGVAAGLSSLIGSEETVQAASAGEPAPPPSAHAAAEELSAAAERAQTLAVAVSQASRIKPVVVREPPPPPVTVHVPAEISPSQLLADWMRENAVFFGNGTELRDPVAASRDLDRLAELLARTTTRIRLVGYTDDRGDARRNAALAADRAATIRRLLIERGVAAERLIPLGRTTRIDLSQKSGPDSPNRRVEFEIAFRYEPSAPEP